MINNQLRSFNFDEVNRKLKELPDKATNQKLDQASVTFDLKVNAIQSILNKLE